MNGKRESKKVDSNQVDTVASQERALFRSFAPLLGHTVKRNRAPWTADDVELLCDLMARRRPIREIAAALGRTQEAVRTKAYQLDRLGSPAL